MLLLFLVINLRSLELNASIDRSRKYVVASCGVGWCCKQLLIRRLGFIKFNSCELTNNECKPEIVAYYNQGLSMV